MVRFESISRPWGMAKSSKKQALQDGGGERFVHHAVFKQLATKERDGVVLCGERVRFEEQPLVKMVVYQAAHALSLLALEAGAHGVFDLHKVGRREERRYLDRAYGQALKSLRAYNHVDG